VTSHVTAAVTASVRQACLAGSLLTLLACAGAPEPEAPPTPRPVEVPAPPVVEAPPAPVAAPEEEVFDAVAWAATLDPTTSTSIGGPMDGRIEGGVALPFEGRGFVARVRPNPEGRYGTVEVVHALVLAAAEVDEAMPGGTARVNDLSLPAGGPIPRHGSHRAGRDVDVLFYLLDADGRPRPSVGAFLDPRGRGVDFQDLADPSDDELLLLDAPRTWRFLQAILEGPYRDDLQRVFVVEHVRALLLAEAERSAAPRAARDRFAQISCQPGYPHDDHLHLRFHCSLEDLEGGCEDAPPVYPWRRAQLRAAGRRPAIHRPRPDRLRSPTVSDAEARAAAGELDAEVERWLAMREAWRRRPHPGREFCP
jgi:penicillin-insensitive murein endopeptidase